MARDLDESSRTRLRIEFDSSESTRDAINQFLESPRGTIPFHTVAERVVHRHKYQELSYNKAVDCIDEKLTTPLAQSALILTSPSIIVNDWSVRLQFDATDPGALAEIAGSLDVLDQFPHYSRVVEPLTVVELARASLVSGKKALNRAKENLIENLNDPETANDMTISRARLVTPPVPPLRPYLRQDDW